MTIPNKSYRLTVLSETLLVGWLYSGGASTEYKPQFSVNDLSLDSGLDEMVRAEIPYGAGFWGENLDPALDHMHLNWGILPNLLRDSSNCSLLFISIS